MRVRRSKSRSRAPRPRRPAVAARCRRACRRGRAWPALLDGLGAPHDVEDEVELRALAGVRRAEAPCDLELPLVEVERVDLGGACDRAPWIAARPTAPQPITPTRAPSQTCAVLSTEPTPVATEHESRDACSAGRSSDRHRRRLVRECSRRERSDAAGRPRPRCRPPGAAASSPWAACGRGGRAAQAPLAARRTTRASRAGHGRRAASPSTPAPTCSTTPAPSWPSTAGRRVAQPVRTTCRSVWQTPLASMRTSTSSGAGLAELELLDGEPPGLGQDDAAIHVSSRSRATVPPISASVRSVSAIRCRIAVSTPSWPARREREGVRAAEQDGVRAEGERLEHVCAGADAAVHEHDRVVAELCPHLDQRVERGDRAVDLAAAVVRDDHALHAGVARPTPHPRR